MQSASPQVTGIGGPRSRMNVTGAAKARFRKALAGGTAILPALACAVSWQGAASAQEAGLGVLVPRGGDFGAFEVIQFATFAGVLGAAMLSAIWLIRERGRIAAENLELRERIAELNAAVQRSDALASMKDQRTVVWGSEHRRPEILGSLPSTPGVPDERAAFLAFGRWLTARSAAALENAIANLRATGAAFDFGKKSLIVMEKIKRVVGHQ